MRKSGARRSVPATSLTFRLAPANPVGNGSVVATSVLVAIFNPNAATIDSVASAIFGTKLAAETLVTRLSAMTTLKARSPIHPLASVARIVKLIAPGAVGAPEIAPVVAFNVSPAGRAPELMAKL